MTWEMRGSVPVAPKTGAANYHEPHAVELADGSLFTLCYQKAAVGEKCSLLGSRWGGPA